MAIRFTYEYVKGYVESYGFRLLSKEYKNTHTNLDIECLEGHIFSSTFNNFKKYKSCTVCSRKKQDRKPKKPNNKKHTQEYIEKIVTERGYKLLEPYINKRTDLKLECPNGHKCQKRLDSFLKGSNCKYCVAENMRYSQEFVEEKFKMFDLKVLSKYKGNNIKIEVECPKGHKYETTYDIAINGKTGCVFCNNKISKGEDKVAKFLLVNKIDFIQQYKYDDCKLYKPLPFDFYLPQHNMLIEYDGVQHYMIIEHFGGFDGFVGRKIRDTVKNIYCQQNNIKLIRIPYWDFDNIEEILIKII